MKIIAIVQARTNSLRLPRKVLKSIQGIPLIVHLLRRVNESKKINKVILATSNQSSDDELVDIVEKFNFYTFRGELDDVLQRYNDCSKKEAADIIIRITGDCPLMDPFLIDEIIEEFISKDWDYIGNSIDEHNLSVPDGYDIEIFKSSLLYSASENALLASEREHVTPWMRKFNAKIKWKHFNHSIKYPYYRLTVDDPIDFEVIQEIFDQLYSINPMFNINDVIKFLEVNPQIAKKNLNTQRNQGYLKSLKYDNLINDHEK